MTGDRNGDREGRHRSSRYVDLEDRHGHLYAEDRVPVQRGGAEIVKSSGDLITYSGHIGQPTQLASGPSGLVRVVAQMWILVRTPSDPDTGDPVPRVARFVAVLFAVATVLLLLVVVLVLVLVIVVRRPTSQPAPPSTSQPTMTVTVPPPPVSPTMTAPAVVTTVPPVTPVPRAAYPVVYGPTSLTIQSGDCNRNSSVAMDTPEVGVTQYAATVTFAVEKCYGKNEEGIAGGIEVDSDWKAAILPKGAPISAESCVQALLTGGGSGNADAITPAAGQTICFKRIDGLNESTPKQIDALNITSVQKMVVKGDAYGWDASSA